MTHEINPPEDCVQYKQHARLLGLTQSDTQVFVTRSYGENLFGKKFFYWEKGHISRKRECIVPTTLQAIPTPHRPSHGIYHNRY